MLLWTTIKSLCISLFNVPLCVFFFSLSLSFYFSCFGCVELMLCVQEKMSWWNGRIKPRRETPFQKKKTLFTHLPKKKKDLQKRKRKESVGIYNIFIGAVCEWADKQRQYDIIKWIKMLSEKRFAHRLSIRSRRNQHMAGECSAETLCRIRWVHPINLFPYSTLLSFKALH